MPRQTTSSQNFTPISTANSSSVRVAVEENRSIENSRNDDEEDVLPRHIQIELTRNRKRIIELEDQIKELKRLSIRKIISMIKRNT